MLAVDSNILVYAHRRESEPYAQARRTLEELAHGDRPWAIPWPCCHEFLGVVTNRKTWKEAEPKIGRTLGLFKVHRPLWHGNRPRFVTA